MTKDAVLQFRYSYFGGVFAKVYANSSAVPAEMRVSYFGNIFYGYAGTAPASGHIKSINGVAWEHVKSYNSVLQSHIKTALGVEG